MPAFVQLNTGTVFTPVEYRLIKSGYGIFVLLTPGTLLRVIISLTLKITRIKNLIIQTTKPYNLYNYFIMITTQVLNLSFKFVTISPNLSNTGLMCLLYTFTILSFIQDHLLPIQVKISRSFSHSQVATDFIRSHAGFRYFSQASFIPRTISSQ